MQVRAIGLNPIDALYVARPADKPGRVVGSDFAGVIDKVGSQVSKWKVGDRVAGFLQGGMYRAMNFPKRSLIYMIVN